MVTISACVVSMAVGLYAGKKRAIGMEWREIASDMYKDMSSAVASIARKASWPFSKGGKCE